MRINELRIHGFKSFANKTVIKFEDNFVGIVGPNGSGKSNIIDAIRWVFGEQSSKNLRGDNSADVIFGGTQKRKRMNQAEVTLVLDNKDQYLPVEYNEVMITRRLYRSGESEYLINNIKCRLKDITELILDTGMGKNSYSIISQGKIEEIVMSKPDKRRTVVEDVAGILKYKKRKETALRKIARTDENLTQVDLILSEMELRLNPLKRQRENALKYLNLKEELEKYEISYLANKIDENKQKYDALDLIIKENSDEQILLNNKINTFEQEIFIKNESISEKSSNLNVVNSKLNEASNNYHKLESQYLILQERMNHTSSDSSDKRVAQLNSLLVEKTNNLDSISYERIQVNEDFKSLSVKLSDLEESISDQRASRFKIIDELEVKKQQLSSVKVPYSIKTILNHYPDAKVVKNLFTCDNKYMTAINIAVGGRSNEIIFNNVDEVKQAISYLKKKNAGRATFIPLDSVKQFNVDEKFHSRIIECEGFIDYAINLISFDEKYSPAFKNILATTVIVDTIDNANKLSNKINKRYRVITLDGELVSTSGTITGGKTKAFNSFMLEDNVSKLESQLKKLDEKYKSATSEVQQVENKYHSKRTERDRVEQRYKDISDEVQNIKYEIAEIKPSQVSGDDELKNDLENLREEISTLTENRDVLSRQLNVLNEEKDSINFNIRTLNEDIKTLNTNLNNNSSEYAKLEVYLSDDTLRLSEEYNLSFEMALNRAQKNIDLDEYASTIKSLKQKIKNLGIVNTNAIEEYDEIKERYDFINVQREDSVNAKNKLLDIIESLDEVVVTQFEDTYIKLRSEFQLIFTELFGGGYADLVLTDEDDLLNTGIEIIAQPPGKKLQTISLLSGGEKALTAIALLFAILRIRTVPFAILDEVEAALDESNVKRYAKYLSVFSESTQFLVITHRQGTMEIVDELYGITMMEKGISSVVNVKLDEGEQLDV